MAEYGKLPRILLDDLRAWRRGERRIAPRFDVNGRAIRGRIYARPGESAGIMPAKVRAVGNMSLRVYRAATDTWEDPIGMGPIEMEVR